MPGCPTPFAWVNDVRKTSGLPPLSLPMLVVVNAVMFLGIIVGILLTIGFAYVSDSMAPAAAAGDTIVETHMVNWDVVQRKMNNFGTDVREGWSRLTGSIKSGT